jgi:hypothetical protein
MKTHSVALPGGWPGVGIQSALDNQELEEAILQAPANQEENQAVLGDHQLQT